jgi:plastocyanin
MRRVLLLLLMAAGLLAVDPALADQTIEAGPVPNSYSTTSITIAQGEKLSFHNGDATASHTVTEQGTAHPLFNTGLVSPGSSKFVEGSQYLTTGTYHFFCEIHPFMTGTLTVTSQGTPVPRVAPTIRLTITATTIASVRRAGGVSTRVTLSDPADVKLTAKSGSQAVAVASRVLDSSAAITLKLTAAGRKLFKSAHRVKLVVTASATGASPKTFDKTATARGSKTLR